MQQDGIKEPMILGTCGRTYIDSSVKLEHLTSLENRLVVNLGMVGSTESAMILRQKATPSGRRILRLVPSTRLTNDRDCIGMRRWQTTKVSTGAYQFDGRTKEVCANLTGQMDPSKLPKSAWPTPVSRPDNKSPEAHLAMKERMGGGRKTITDIQVKMKAQSEKATWVTPNTRDWKDSAGQKQIRNDGKTRIDQCPRQMAATVQATGATTGSNATTQKRGAPNPAFAFWLMGFSFPWMLSVSRALQTFRKPSRKTASKRGA